MKNGYYLSVYIHIDELSHLMNLSVRHDQNLSLWYIKDNDVELVRYWELERVTGQKQHKKSFLNVHTATIFINELLKDYGLTIDDMVEIWGVPQLNVDGICHFQQEYLDYTCHSVAHLFSALLMESEVFYNNTIIGLAVDSGPDYVIPAKDSHYYYLGCLASMEKLKC